MDTKPTKPKKPEERIKGHICGIKIKSGNLIINDADNGYNILHFINNELKINPFDNYTLNLSEFKNFQLDLKEVHTVNGIGINLTKELQDNIQKGTYFKIQKKDTCNEFPYCFFSSATLQALLYLSKKKSTCPLKKLVSKEMFTEFFLDLTYTNLRAVFFLDLDLPLAKQSIFTYYNMFIHYRLSTGKINLSKTKKNLQDFYELIKDTNIGMYSTEESFLQYQLFKDYDVITLQDTDEQECSVSNFIIGDTRFVKNKIADDILIKYINEFENGTLAFSEEKIKQIEKLDNESNSKFSAECMLALNALHEKEKHNEGSANYLKCDSLISKLSKIFEKPYETYGEMMTITDSLFTDDKDVYSDKNEIQFTLSKIKVFEFMLYLQKEGSIDIENIDISKNRYKLRVRFKNSIENIKNNLVRKDYIFESLKLNVTTRQIFIKDRCIYPPETDKSGRQIITKNTTYEKRKLKRPCRLNPMSFDVLAYVMKHNNKCLISDVFRKVTGRDSAETRPKREKKQKSELTIWKTNCATNINNLLEKFNYRLYCQAKLGLFYFILKKTK